MQGARVRLIERQAGGATAREPADRQRGNRKGNQGDEYGQPHDGFV